jgi:hypothetical protein
MFIFFLFERKNKENEPKERKTLPQGDNMVRGKAPETPYLIKLGIKHE